MFSVQQKARWFVSLPALNKAVEIARRDPKEAERIDARLARGDTYWTDVAIDCARHCQQQSLELMPWENPPMYGDIDKPRLDQHAFDLLRKLLSLGLSRFEPQPLLAIEQAEGREKTKPVRYVTDKPTAAASRPSQTPAK